MKYLVMLFVAAFFLASCACLNCSKLDKPHNVMYSQSSNTTLANS